MEASPSRRSATFSIRQESPVALTLHGDFVVVLDFLFCGDRGADATSSGGTGAGRGGGGGGRDRLSSSSLKVSSSMKLPTVSSKLFAPAPNEPFNPSNCVTNKLVLPVRTEHVLSSLSSWTDFNGSSSGASDAFIGEVNGVKPAPISSMEGFLYSLSSQLSLLSMNCDQYHLTS